LTGGRAASRRRVNRAFQKQIGNRSMARTHPSFFGPLVFGGSAGQHLLTKVCQYLTLEPGQIEVSRFSDGETGVKIIDNVRGADCYLIQPTCTPVNENLAELLLCIDALRRASAERINVVMPYFGYARQDRKEQGRVALSAKLIANLLATAGASRVICLDLHSAQIQGFFDIPVDHLYGGPVLLDYLLKQEWAKDLVIVSPDVGNVKMSRGFARRLNASLAIIDKRRPQANVSEVMNIIGDVKGRPCLLTDDLIDTAGTLCNAAQALMDAGATSVSAMATHAVLSGPARRRLEQSVLERVIVTNSIDQHNDEELTKLETVSIAPLLAEAVHRIHNFLSVSELFALQTQQGSKLQSEREARAAKLADTVKTGATD
jgi:ribose-phosphate pyrophosphokinase